MAETLTKISYEQFASFLTSAVWEKHNHPSLRMGQAYWNALARDFPELAMDIKRNHGSLDPFYWDDAIPEFLAWIVREYVA